MMHQRLDIQHPTVTWKTPHWRTRGGKRGSLIWCVLGDINFENRKLTKDLGLVKASSMCTAMTCRWSYSARTSKPSNFLTTTLLVTMTVRRNDCPHNYVEEEQLNNPNLSRSRWGMPTKWTYTCNLLQVGCLSIPTKRIKHGTCSSMFFISCVFSKFLNIAHFPWFS